MQLLRSISIVASVLSATVVSGLPTASPDNVADLVQMLDRRAFGGQQLTGCSLTGAVVPTSDGTTVLATPEAGLTITRVVLGRGTQNYTCADSTDSTIPVGAGALAVLYDASCLAVKNPTLLHKLPNVLVSISSSLTGVILKKIAGDAVVVGHHYFPSVTTPVFDFRITAGQTQIFTGVRDQAAPARSSAAKGGPANQQFGAVDWLRLKAIAETSVGYKLAYRVETAGGKAPPTCKGRPSTFSIEYATEYWFLN